MIFTIMFISLFYLLIAGGSGKQIHMLGQSKCTRQIHEWEHCGHYYSGIIAGMFWPVALPIAVGMKGSDTIPTPVSKEIKAEKKRESELRAVQHEAQLEQAELMREEMMDKRLELVYRRGEQEKKLLELNAAGVDTDRLKREAGIE